MKKIIILLLLLSFCFAGIIYDGKMLKQYTDEGYIIYDVLNPDSTVQYSDAFGTPEALGIDSTVIAVLLGELPDSVLAELQPEIDEATGLLGWIAGILTVLLGGGYLTTRKGK